MGIAVHLSQARSGNGFVVSEPLAAVMKGLFKTRRWVRFQNVFGTVAVAALIYFVVKSISAGQIDLRTLALEWFIPAVLAATVSTIMGLCAFATLAKLIAPEIQAWQIAKIQLRSLPARYLPGSFWNVPAKWVKLQEANITAIRITTLLTLELGILYVSGGIIFLIASIIRPWQIPFIPYYKGVDILVLLVVVAISAGGLEVARCRLDVPVVMFYPKILWTVAMVWTGWAFMAVCLGLSSLALGGHYGPDIPQNIAALVQAVSGGFIGGFVFILSPGGLGIREGIMYVLLNHLDIGTSIIAVSICQRFAMAISDFALISFSYVKK